MMKLSNLDFLRLLPQFMRDDGAVKGLAAGLNKIIPKLAASVENMSTWDRIDNLSESELDALAWELNILWYDHRASIDVKRELVKNSDRIYQHLGTKWAVESVIATYFGDGHVEEWFEYGGNPGFFRVVSSNPSINAERLAEFINILNKVKRASAKLEVISIDSSGELILSAGAAFHDISTERHTARWVFEPPAAPETTGIIGKVVDGLYLLIGTDGSEITPELSEDGLLTWPGVTASVSASGILNFAKS